VVVVSCFAFVVKEKVVEVFRVEGGGSGLMGVCWPDVFLVSRGGGAAAEGWWWLVGVRGREGEEAWMVCCVFQSVCVCV